MSNAVCLSLPPAAGDRIAVVSKGSLICCGSFEFLKQRFGRGHKLTLVTASQSTTPCEGASAQCDRVEAVTEFLESFVKSVILDEVCGRELRYLLPFSGARASVLTQLFRELEGAKERLGVVSYGLTACSMEEVGGVCSTVCVCVGWVNLWP